MKPIGGYFELEINEGKNLYHFQSTFKSGRSALHFILKFLQPQNVYIPFYTCNALLEPFQKSKVPFSFYAIDSNLEPKSLPELKENEYFLYINYFDLKRKTVQTLSDRYGDRLIVDCSQAFYMNGNGKSWFFNSCRKFFGVPDGAYLMLPTHIDVDVQLDRNENYTVQHLIKRLEGKPGEGYPFFIENEQQCDGELKQMSIISERLLSNIDYDHVKRIRQANFSYLHQVFRPLNQLQIEPDGECVPMVYPLLMDKTIQREKLWAKELFIARYWPDVLKRKTNIFETEAHLAENILPLPIDQRYTTGEMQFMAEQIMHQ